MTITIIVVIFGVLAFLWIQDDVRKRMNEMQEHFFALRDENYKQMDEMRGRLADLRQEMTHLGRVDE